MFETFVIFLLMFFFSKLILQSTLLEWRLVFWIAVLVLCATNIVYVIMGSAEVQPWNDPSNSLQKKDQEGGKCQSPPENDKTSHL